MPEKKGLIIKLPRNRKRLFYSYVADGREFSEPVPYFSHDNSLPLLCFITESDSLTHVAYGYGGQIAGTGLKRVNLESFFPLGIPLPLNAILDNVTGNLANGIQARFEEGGLLTSRGTDAVIRILIDYAPDIEIFLSRYSDEYQRLLRDLTPAVRKNLAVQKEALLTALLVAGPEFDRKLVREWTPTERPVSFLDGLVNSRLSETQMILNDFQGLPGFSTIRGHIKGTAIFSSPTEHLTVIYADTEPLDTLTGADLIYYNETYQSFIFVQYKAMESGEVAFYRPDDQLRAEIIRMETLLSQLGDCQIQNCGDFRLDSNPFYLKLCPRLDFEPDSSSLTKGMYIPLEYWKVLESSGRMLGPRGGQVVNFDNVERYLTNTDFAVLVTKGWVGSDPHQSGIIAPMIQEILRAGRAALYAVKRPNSNS